MVVLFSPPRQTMCYHAMHCDAMFMERRRIEERKRNVIWWWGMKARGLRGGLGIVCIGKGGQKQENKAD